MNKERGIFGPYKGVKRDDQTSVILIEQGEEGKSIAKFEDPAVKLLLRVQGIFMIQLLWQDILIKSRFKLCR